MIKLIYIDLFCGAGGTSTGVSSARLDGEQCAKVVACVNHDANAIASHKANHPEAMHFTEDIRTFELSPMIAHLRKCQAENPEALTVLWASLECTNFSRAKGGMPRDADSRTLAEHLFRYIEAIDPDYIQIENVEEFMSWGDMDMNGRPLSKDKGRCYLKWIKNVKKYGYDFEHRILNAADFGAYTSRKRFFGIFAKRNLPIIWPEQTHCKGGSSDSLFADVQPWRPVKEVLDFSNEGESIFGRKKPLAEKTLERIYAGLVKFVAGGKVATHNRRGTTEVRFLSKQFSGDPDSKNISIELPAGAITTIDHHAMISCRFLMNPQFESAGSNLDNPCFTLIARMDKRPPYLVITETGNVTIKVYATDSAMTVKIKEFMALYGIIDIKMRMLMISELKLIMGFPKDYVLLGTQAEQKKYIGNAVEVTMSRKLCEALCRELQNIDLTKRNIA